MKLAIGLRLGSHCEMRGLIYGTVVDFDERQIKMLLDNGDIEKWEIDNFPQIRKQICSDLVDKVPLDGCKSPLMLMNESDYPRLPVWSAMVVVGKPVTKEQAAQIIVQTCGRSLFTNHIEFRNKLRECIGMPERIAGENWFSCFEAANLIWEQYGVFNLRFLENRQIVCARPEGPDGWCNWCGIIYAANMNIGSRPSCLGVLTEWELIAKRFPFLDLRCQLFDGACNQDCISPVIEYRVADGGVQTFFPKGALQKPIPPKPMDLEVELFGNAAEIGCTIEQFKWALSLCKEG